MSLGLVCECVVSLGAVARASGPPSAAAEDLVQVLLVMAPREQLLRNEKFSYRSIDCCAWSHTNSTSLTLQFTHQFAAHSLIHLSTHSRPLSHSFTLPPSSHHHLHHTPPHRHTHHQTPGDEEEHDPGDTRHVTQFPTPDSPSATCAAHMSRCANFANTRRARTHPPTHPHPSTHHTLCLPRSSLLPHTQNHVL